MIGKEGQSIDEKKVRERERERHSARPLFRSPLSRADVVPITGQERSDRKRKEGDTRTERERERERKGERERERIPHMSEMSFVVWSGSEVT